MGPLISGQISNAVAPLGRPIALRLLQPLKRLQSVGGGLSLGRIREIKGSIWRAENLLRV